MQPHRRRYPQRHSLPTKPRRSITAGAEGQRASWAGRWATIWIALALVAFVASCTGDAPGDDATASDVRRIETLPGGTCGLNLAAGLDDEAQIQALIEAEGRFMVAREIGPLMALWAEESRVTNARHMPDDADEHQVWRGKDAIRHRYLNVVFPSAPEAVATVALQIDIDGEQAHARGTTQINGEVSPDGDMWQFRRLDGCWHIVELMYNLEPLDAGQ